MRIMIAEDDLTSRTVLAAGLKNAGHEVVETVDGAEAWEVMRKPDAPRLAILDWMMPVMSGLEVLRRIRALETEHRPYVFILTARDEKSDLITGLEAGADDYLAKPYDPSELRARVDVGRRIVEMQDRLSAKVGELRQALAEIKTLQGILPICSYCKQIRDDRGYWDQVEAYVARHSNVRFSHGICPDCAEEHFPGLWEGEEARRNDGGDGEVT